MDGHHVDPVGKVHLEKFQVGAHVMFADVFVDGLVCGAVRGLDVVLDGYRHGLGLGAVGGGV